MINRNYLPGLTLLLCAMLTNCISSEPRQLVPSITLSGEVVVLDPDSGNDAVHGGVQFGMVTAVNESDSLTNISILPGVRVRSVTPDGAVALAGIRAGDVILSIDGRETNHPDLIDTLASATTTARTFEFTVRRNTTVFAATVNARPLTDDRVAPVELYRADPVATRAGYNTALLQSGGRQLSGARVITLFADSPLPAHGITVDDIILALNGEPVTSAQGFITSLHTDHQLGDSVTVTVLRAGVTSDRRLQLWDPGRRISRVSLRPLLNYESSVTPTRTRFSLLDLWLFSLFSYQNNEGEKQYRFFSLFGVTSGYGELLEEQR